MDDASVIEAWLAEAIRGYAHEKEASGQWTENEALDLWAKEYQKLLPEAGARVMPPAPSSLWKPVRPRDGGTVHGT